MQGEKKMRAKPRAGFSLIEVTIILVVLSILAAIMAPVLSPYVRNAKVVRAREDVQALGSAIAMFMEDTANSYFMLEGTGGGGTGEASRDPNGSAPDQTDDSNLVEMLVSDGDIPECGSSGSCMWTRVVDLDEIDFFEYHLVTNTPGNGSGNAYRTPSDLTNDGGISGADDPMFARDSSGGFNSEFAWRGPYITPPIDPDPWGDRYAANVQYLDPVTSSTNSFPQANGHESAVVVLSAGPDEETDTLWNVDGLTPGDDDILYTVSGNSRP